MDIQTFKKSVVLLPREVSVMARGRHGIGKSEMIYQIAEELGLPMMERRLSQLSEGDLIGLPHKMEKTTGSKKESVATKFLPMEWFVQCQEVPHLIFLDELDRAVPEVLQAVFELLLSRSIQGNQIHPECRIFAAINGGEYGALYNVNTLDAAMLDRMWIVDLTPSGEEWLEWARENSVQKDIISFIDTNREWLETNMSKQTDSIKVTPSRRSWKRLSDTLLKNPEIIKYMHKLNAEQDKGGNELYSLFISLCSGFVGIEATSNFANYLTEQNKYFKAETIMNDFDSVKSRLQGLRIDQHNDLIEKVKEFVTENELEPQHIVAYSKYMSLLPKELKLALNAKISTDLRPEDLEKGIKLTEAVWKQIADAVNETK